MAEPAGIKVKNLKQVNKALKAVGVPNEAVKEAGKQSAQIVVREAKSLVPVRTGKLRDSIRVNSTARGRVTLAAGNNRKTKSGVPYANPIHWGWFKRNIMPQPFFSRALGYTREEIFRQYFNQMDKLIREEYAKSKLGNAE